MKYSILYLIISFLIIINSCTKDCKCSEKERIEGDIVQLANLNKCYELLNDTSYIITKYTAYLALSNEIDTIYYQNYKSYCDTASIDSVDFLKYSLIGYFTEGTGCDIKFHKSFLKDSVQKSYTYLIEKEICGECNTIEFSMNWILVKKVDTTYTFKFHVINN